MITEDVFRESSEIKYQSMSNCGIYMNLFSCYANKLKKLSHALVMKVSISET